ncbi:hypothetical protein LF1_58130 [Rubripirellula obstinata]|uniref:Uncharacterized protein n=1 Tax=Rubripirellula obstinata TaxID=406547 RepID=A0A5B1CA92_9BACT|nr:hypothetical protein LF1_58130 [Rubripirellula obstinata]
MVSFFVCLQVFRRRPVMRTVIRLSRGHLLPASRPAGHIQRTTNTALPPTLDQHPSADCPAGHQPTPEFQYSINARADCTAWHQPTPVLPNSIHCLTPQFALPATPCYAFHTVIVTHVDEVRADGPHRNGVSRITNKSLTSRACEPMFKDSVQVARLFSLGICFVRVKMTT